MTVFSGTAGGIPRFMGTSYCTKHHETAGSLALKSDVKPFIKTSLCQNFKMYVRLVLLFLCFIEPNFTASLQRDEVICINNYKCLRKNQIENPNKLDKVSDSLDKIDQYLELLFSIRFAEISSHPIATAAGVPRITLNTGQSAEDFAPLKSSMEKLRSPAL